MTISDSVEEWFDLSYSNEPASYYYLVLEIHSDHVAAMWYHHTKNLVTGFATYPYDGNVETLIKEHPYLQAEFKETIILYFTPNYLTLPKQGIDISDEAVFQLSNTFNAEDAELRTTDLVNLQARTLFPVPSKQLQAFNLHLHHCKVVAHVAPFIEAEFNEIKSSNSGQLVSVQVHQEYIDVRVYNEHRLQLVNSFFQSGKEDVAYYVLYASELVGVDPESCLLEVCGAIEIGDDTWQLVSKYWKNISIRKALPNLKLSSKLGDFSRARYHHLTQGLLCAS